jgi:hypothetical protein
MIIELWHYNFKLRYNKIDSQHKKDLNPAEIDEILNDAIKIWCETQYSGNNITKQGAEVTQQKIDNLSSLLIQFPVQPLVTSSLITEGVYEFPLSETKGLIFPYFHLMRVYGKITGCSEKVETSIIQHDDLTYVLSDPFKKPSNKFFKRLVATFGKSSIPEIESSLFIYTDGFPIDGIYPEYYKKPNIVSIGGYKDINNVIKTKVECDLPEPFHTQIIDIAVQEASRILGDTQSFQLDSQKSAVNK